VAGEQATYKILVASSNVTNIVGSRVYGGGQAPEDASLPYVTFQVVGDADRTPVLTGKSPLVAKRIQVNCVTTSYATLVPLAEKVRLALHCYAGTIGTETVRGAFLENELDVTVPRVEGGDKYVFIKVQDYVVWCDEATS